MCTRRAIVLFCVLFFSVTWIHQKCYCGYTPASRLALLRCIIEKQTLSIDSYHELTTDKAYANGHYFSDKAPGTVALALPAIVGTDLILRGFGSSLRHDSSWLATSWIACAFSQGLPVALGGVALFLWLRRRTNDACALITTLALNLGSLPLPYSTMLFSHAQVIGLISIALWALDVFGETCQSHYMMALAGFSLGLALASEYSCGLVVAGLWIYVLLERAHRWISFTICFCVPLLLVPLYSFATLGHFFALPYSYQANFWQMNEGFHSIGLPNVDNLVRLLFEPTRGFVFWTPFFVMALFAGWPNSLHETRGNRTLRHMLMFGVPALHIVVMSGRTWDWQAGYTLSARYMSPVIPLLALPCALGLRRFWRIGVLLSGYSIAIIMLATVTNACPEYDVYNPLTELHIPAFLKGDFALTLVDNCGVNRTLSIIIYYSTIFIGVGWLMLDSFAEHRMSNRNLPLSSKGCGDGLLVEPNCPTNPQPGGKAPQNGTNTSRTPPPTYEAKGQPPVRGGAGVIDSVAMKSSSLSRQPASHRFDADQPPRKELRNYWCQWSKWPRWLKGIWK